MAGLDTVDPAYPCVLPASPMVSLFADTTIPPNCPIAKEHPLADWIRVIS